MSLLPSAIQSREARQQVVPYLWPDQVIGKQRLWLVAQNNLLGVV